MAAPLIRRRSVLAFEVEATTGTAETLVAADAVLNCYNAAIDPTIGFGQRDGQAALSQIAGVPGGRAGRCTFETDFIGGASAPMLWTDVLLGCGMKVATGAIYRPESRPPEAASSGAKTLTIGLYEDGRLKMLRGAMGTFKILGPSGEHCRMLFDFQGVWVPPVDAAMLAPTYLTTSPLRFAGSALSTGGNTSLRVGSHEFDMGNEVVMREDGSDASGFHSAVIVGRRPTWRIDPEGQLVAGYDAYGKFIASTEEAITWSLGTAGNRVQVSFPKAQIAEISNGDRTGKRIDSILYQLNRSAAAGDDECAFTVD